MGHVQGLRCPCFSADVKVELLLTWLKHPSRHSLVEAIMGTFPGSQSIIFQIFIDWSSIALTVRLIPSSNYLRHSFKPNNKFPQDHILKSLCKFHLVTPGNLQYIFTNNPQCVIKFRNYGHSCILPHIYLYTKGQAVSNVIYLKKDCAEGNTVIVNGQNR